MPRFTKKLHMNIKTKIIVNIMAVLLLLSAGLSTMNYVTASKSLENLATSLQEEQLKTNMTIADTYLEKYYGDLSYQKGVLVDENGQDITGDMRMINAVSRDAGVASMIFAKKGDDFIRISTSILNNKGESAVGDAMLGKDSPAYANVVEGHEYVGQVNILDIPYWSVYKPLLDKNGQIIGLLFVGISQAESSAQIVGYLDRHRNLALLTTLLALLLSLPLAYFIGKSISKPIVSMAGQLRQLAAGDLSVEADQQLMAKKDEIGLLATSLDQIVQSIKGLTNETNVLVAAAAEGKLDARGNTARHRGEYRKIVEGINEALDAVIGPLNMAAEYVERISQGDIPSKITDKYNGDFNEIKNNLNHCIDGLDGLVESSRVLACMANNDYTYQVEGQYQGIYAQTAEAVNTVRERLLRVVEINTNISSGHFAHELELYHKIGRRSEADQLVPSFIKSMENIERLVNDAQSMAQAAVSGKLDVRADASLHQGDYRKVIEGLNATMDALISPLNMAADFIQDIADGHTPAKITEEYRGDYNIIKNNMNTCIDSLNFLVEEIGEAINAGLEGKLEQRADAGRARGVYSQILSGVNATMDALIAPINEALQVTNELAQGKLNIKMTGHYQGDNAKLKNGMNVTIDSLAHVIGEVSSILSQVADGNLDVNLDKDFQGDFVVISTAVKHIIESMNEVISDINHAAEEVAGGSQQVADSSQVLARGASEQASAIEQLTATVTEIAAQTRQNAANANKANELALNARDNAAQGNGQMQKMLEAMEEINASSANISKIIKVIDEIAFQTNILALNAAVEAARAGQHGKGFAVVAEEVRNLAARSASAAQETTDLIEGSIRKVQDGAKIANDTALALSKIVDGVGQAAGLVGDIAVASNEQATGIAQVDQGIGQVSQVVQTNSVTAQQSAAASEELSGQAELLTERVAMFRLKGNRSGSREYDAKVAPINQGKSSSMSPDAGLGIREAAAVSGRSRIILDDRDFGKY
ncbi:MAG TPA: methyl-accepting chemotaxis protein [Syntrophomonas sp.]|nr:methyl-accepting chemotaxis protein [Syntrophomonas sp.]